MMFTASRKVCHWFCWQRQQRHKVLADTSKVIASLSRRYHIHSVQSLCSKLLMRLVKCEVSSESYNELAELPHYRSSHQFQYVRFTGTWKDRHYCRKMHILTKTSKEPEMTHHTGTLSLSLQIWKHRYDDKEDQVVIPQVTSLNDLIFFDQIFSMLVESHSPCIRLYQIRLRSTHSSCVRIHRPAHVLLPVMTRQ